MCGIVGVWDRGAARTDDEVLRRMLAAIAHRGPDGEGLWRDGDLALGHRRLAILDLGPTAHQPMETADGRGVIAYNGEVYNFAALRTELEAEGAVFTSSGDTQVVLEALHRWGPARAVERFDGMFAFAYLDRRDGTLWIARDRLGIKPLHVLLAGSRLLFASEIKALLAHPAVTPRPNGHALAALVTRGRIDAPWTIFDGIESVEPGALWRVTTDEVHRGLWYDLIERLPVDRILAGARRPLAAFVEELDDRLRRSVAMHLVSDVPVATMCSGGVDSSLVTALAREVQPGLRAYVADLGGAESEGPVARRVAAHLGVEITSVVLDEDAWRRLWVEATWHRDQPTFHPSDGPHLAIVRRCRADGIRVLLTGEGADELFGGYPWHQRLRDRWRAHLRRARLYGRSRRSRRLERMAFSPLVDTPAAKEPGLRLRLVAGLQADRELRGAVLLERLAAVEPAWDRAFLAQGFDDLVTQLGSILLRHDRAGMGAGVEMRVPFLETDVIDLGLGLPRRAKLHRRRAKWVVKELARRHLPRDVVDARKRGFPVPSGWTRGVSGVLRGGRAADLLGWSAKARAALLPRIAEDPGLSFVLPGLEIWARLFLEGESPEQVAEGVRAARGR